MIGYFISKCLTALELLNVEMCGSQTKNCCASKVEKIRLIINSIVKFLFSVSVFQLRHRATLESDNLVGCPTNNHIFIVNPEVLL